MILTDKHLEAIKEAAKNIDYGKITITFGTGEHLDIIVENRIRLPKEEQNEQQNKQKPTRIISCNNRPRH